MVGSPTSSTVDWNSRDTEKPRHSDIMDLNIFLSLLILSSVGGFRSVNNPTCGIALDVKSFIFLDKFCEDCFNLYRLEELYQMCQANCYDNDTFFLCLNVTLVNKETTEKASEIISSLTEPRKLFDVLS